MIERLCIKCKSKKPLVEFHLNSSYKCGRTSTCKACTSKKTKENWAKQKDSSVVKKRNRLKTKKYNLKAVYNMTLEDYNILVKQQNGLCAICGTVETTSNQFGPRSLCVDHDHKTGKVRGLLCSQCNHLLGNAKDNIEILQKARVYLLG